MAMGERTGSRLVPSVSCGRRDQHDRADPAVAHPHRGMLDRSTGAVTRTRALKSPDRASLPPASTEVYHVRAQRATGHRASRQCGWHWVFSSKEITTAHSQGVGRWIETKGLVQQLLRMLVSVPRSGVVTVRLQVNLTLTHWIA